MPARARSSKQPAKKTSGPSGVQLGELTARAMILQGAQAAFAEHGIRAASVDDILERAAVSRRTFYRFYDSKEDVALALYTLGTDWLLDACRRAVAENAAPLAQLEGCIDAHLEHARDMGRLMFVLGGEAQAFESRLHARRREVHEQIAELLAKGIGGDPMVFRGLVLALEGLTRAALEEGDEGRKVSEASLARVRSATVKIAAAMVG